MEDNNFDVNLSLISDDFNNKTLRYRINGFAYACNIKDFKNENVEESIKVSKNINPLGTSITIGGEYNDLNFFFTNYYKKEKLDKKIIDLPFSILLTKNVDKNLYGLNIETISGKKTQFTIYRYCSTVDSQSVCDDIRFVANITDFSQILKLVKSFVDNPKMVFNTYNGVVCKYERYFNQEDLEKGIQEDEYLDKPSGKIKKLCKKLKN